MPAPGLGSRLADYSHKGYELYHEAGGHAWANDSLLVPGAFSGYTSNYAPIQISVLPPQSRPARQDAECELPQGFLVGGIGVAMADGSARSISSNVNPYTWALLILPADGSPMPADAY